MAAAAPRNLRYFRASAGCVQPQASRQAGERRQEPALQVTREQLQEVVGVVSVRHRGTAAGPSGWMFEMICDA